MQVSFEIITPGKNADGYWTNDDLVKQLEKVMPLFARFHPGCELLSMFDNSGNHHKKSPDGLFAWDRNISDGGKMTKQQDGWWIDDNGVRRVQSMVFPDGTVKGLRTILTERGNWGYTRRIDAARATLAAYPDFTEQGEWLHETVTNAGHSIDYYPKFHCELNYIEMVWAFCKQQLRRRCTYSFPDMRTALPNTLHEVPFAFHRRALRHCTRFMTGYRQGLHGLLLDYVMKKCQGHRIIPAFVGQELELLAAKYKEERDMKLNAKIASGK